MIRRRFDLLVLLGCVCASVTLLLVLIRPTGRFELSDFRNPIALGNGLHEAIRLNELVAQIQYSCQNSRCFPSTSKCWSVCLDFTQDSKAFQLLSIPSIESLTFESSFLAAYPKSRATVLVPIGSDANDVAKLKKSHSQVHYKTVNLIPLGTKEALKGVHLGDIFKDLPKSSLLPVILKWDCLSANAVCADLLKEFISLHKQHRVQQLHLTVRIASRDSGLIFKWYRVLNDLFFTSNFALYNSAQRGECGRFVSNCEYRLSFERLPSDGTVAVSAPVMGLGSPEEEYSRFVSYATTVRFNCKEIGKIEMNLWTDGYSGSSWKLCMDQPYGLTYNRCLVYYFNFADSDSTDDSFIQPLSNEGCEIYIFDTKLRHNMDKPEQRLHYRNYGLAASNNANVSYHERSGIQLMSLWEIVKQLNHLSTTIDVMMWDIRGYEWDVLEAVLSSGVLKRFNQIVVRSRVWYGEDHNFRAFFTQLYRLQMQQFRLFDVSQVNSNANFCRGCMELGWVRVADSP